MSLVVLLWCLDVLNPFKTFIFHSGFNLEKRSNVVQCQSWWKRWVRMHREVFRACISVGCTGQRHSPYTSNLMKTLRKEDCQTASEWLEWQDMCVPSKGEGLFWGGGGSWAM